MLFSGSDANLIQQIARGHEDALDALYTRHGLTLLTYLVQQLEDHELAEEVLQDVMIDVWKGAAKFRNESTVRTWLFSIARYRAIRHRHYRHPKHDPLDDEIVTTENGLEETVYTVMQRSDVQQAISELSPQHREVLNLIFFHDLSGNETAAVLDIPLGTLKSRLWRAKDALRKLLQEGV